MKKLGATALVVLTLIFATTVPSEARWSGARSGGHARWSGGHSRGHSHGHHHHHGHGGWGWWGAGAFFGGLAFGTALSYPYYAYAYPPAYPAYNPVVSSPAPVVYQQAPAPPPAVQREVVYPHGKYVLHGDGVSQPWQWVWVSIPSAPSSGPPPAPQ